MGGTRIKQALARALEAKAAPAPPLALAQARAPAGEYDEVERVTDKQNTKRKVKEWLLKYGIDEKYIQDVPEEKIAAADQDMQEELRNMIIVPYTIKSGDVELAYKVTIMISKGWIQVKLLLNEAAAIPPEVEKDLYVAILQANFNFCELTFSLGPNKDIFIEADMPVETTYDNFKYEYASIEGGADYYLSVIVPGILENYKPEGTFGEWV